MSLFSIGSWQSELSAFSAQCNASLLSFQSNGSVRGRLTDGPLSRFPSTRAAAAMVALTVVAVSWDLRRHR